MKRYTYNDTLRLLEKAVADYGADWIDPNAENANCAYAYITGDDEMRHCIVGHVLESIGVDTPTIVNDDASSVLQIIESEGTAKFDLASYSLLALAQERQDDGTPWGEAVEAAVSDLDEMVSEGMVDYDRW